MSAVVYKVLAAGPGVVLGGSFESVLLNGQPTQVTRELWLENFASTRVLLHYMSLGWSGDASTPTIEEWPYTLLGATRQTLLDGDRYFDFALKARSEHGESFGLLLQRAIGLTLTVKVVTVSGPAFLTCGLWVPKQDRPQHFMVNQQKSF